jgi:hypothetical protein
MALLALALAATPATAQHRLVLRDSTLVAGVILQVSPDGVSLRGEGPAKTWGWDEVESGVAPDQKAFDTFIKDIGDPLFRIRQRLKSGDFLELAGPAEKLFPLFRDRTSGVAGAVCLATHIARDARHQRESALEPLLAWLAMRAIPGHTREPRFVVAGNRGLTVSPLGLAEEFPPIFFDAPAAKEALASCKARLAGWPGGKPTAGARIYVASLADRAGDPATATGIAKPLASLGAADWQVVLAAQREVLGGSPGESMAALEKKLDSLPEPARMAGIYFRGLACRKAAPTGRATVISFLTLPARYGTTCPEMAAAGLYQAAAGLEATGDARAALAVRRELLTRHRATYFGSRLAQESTTPNPGGLQ